MWQTSWQPAPARLPHWLVIDLQKAVAVSGVTYLPRADLANGRIARFEIYLRHDAKTGNRPVAKGDWANDAKLKTVRFDQPLTVRYLKLAGVSEVNGRQWSSAADIDLILDESPSRP